jgi:hypothetical protein
MKNRYFIFIETLLNVLSLSDCRLTLLASKFRLGIDHVLLMEENMRRAMSSESQKLFFTRNKNRLVSLDMKKSVIFSSKLTKTPCRKLQGQICFNFSGLSDQGNKIKKSPTVR